MSDTPSPTPEPAKPAAAANQVTIDLGDLADEYAGQTITIRPHLSYAANQRIETAAVKMRAQIEQPANRAERRARARENQELELSAEAAPLEYATAVVDEAVIEWTLTGYDGKVLAANGAGLRSPQAPADLLDDAINEIVGYYESRRPKLRKRPSSDAGR